MSASALPSAALDIDTALKRRSWWRVALPAQLEHDFMLDRMESRLTRCIVSGWLALLVFDAFLLVDWLMANDVFMFSVTVRLLVFTPLGCLLMWSLRRYFANVIAFKRWWLTDLVIVLSGWAAALCLALILLKSQSPLAMYYHAGFMVVMLYGTLVQQLETKLGVVFLLGILALHALCAAYGQPMPMPLRVAMLEILLVTAAFSLIGMITVERSRRRRYLLLRRERNLSESLLGVNMQLQQLSRSDVLTGVGNRRHFHEYMQQVWERASGSGTPVSVLMLDVDHFKAYNDRYGHPAGDECLKQVAQSVVGSLRTSGDFVARYGGEEFVAVLPNTSSEIAEQAAERVRQGVEALAMRHEGSSTSPVVTISVGVATVIPGEAGMDADKLVSCADRALYDAKKGARNRVSVYRR